MSIVFHNTTSRRGCLLWFWVGGLHAFPTFRHLSQVPSCLMPAPCGSRCDRQAAMTADGDRMRETASLCEGPVIRKPALQGLRRRFPAHGVALSAAARHGNPNSTLLVTVVTADVSCIHDSFLTHAEWSLGGPVSLSAFCLDSASYLHCSQLRDALAARGSRLDVFCADLHSWYPPALRYVSDVRLTSNAGYQSCAYHLATWAKPLVLMHLMEARHAMRSRGSLLFFDADVVSDPHPEPHLHPHPDPHPSFHPNPDPHSDPGVRAQPAG